MDLDVIVALDPYFNRVALMEFGVDLEWELDLEMRIELEIERGRDAEL